MKAQQNAGFARWQKIKNLKEAAKTLNFLTENNLLQYVDLETKIAEVAAAFDTAADSLKTAETRIWEMSALMKNISNYQKTKNVYDGYKTAADKNIYRRENKKAIFLHESAGKALKSFAGESGKLPNPATLQADYSRLVEKKNSLRAEYSKLKNQANEYGIIKKNVDSILNPTTEKTRHKERGAEL